MIFAFRGALKLVGTTACAILVSAAAPALANTNSTASTTTTSADVVQPLRDAGELADIGDTRFKSLFTTILENERNTPVLGTVEAPTA